LGVDLSGVVYTAQAAVPALKANGGGTILATSSAASLVAYHSIALYSATKAGVNGLVRGLALDLGCFGIRVNAIAPAHGMSPNFLMPPGAPVVGRSNEEVACPQASGERAASDAGRRGGRTGTGCGNAVLDPSAG
jgi:NAD(P)-dependent dehydrogenase (short-subunit alcohol dehydrogenase family)